MMVEQRQIDYGARLISYSLRRRPRRTLSISVHPNGDVSVVAPQTASNDRIERVIRKRARWITRQLRALPSLRHGPPSPIVSGAALHYLGRQYRLRVVKAPVRRIRLIRGRVVIETPNPAAQSSLRIQLENWLTERANAKFAVRLAVCLDRLPPRLKREPTGLLVRPLKARWGSMTAAGRMVLNRDLVHAPTNCIDYVIVHELCHRHYPRHDRAFWRALSGVMPDWQKHKQRLEEERLEWNLLASARP